METFKIEFAKKNEYISELEAENANIKSIYNGFNAKFNKNNRKNGIFAARKEHLRRVKIKGFYLKFMKKF